jgi:large subunit ribosomal protein L25
VTIRVDGSRKREITLVREIKHHPVTGTVLHADFMRVDADRPVEVAVPVVLEGEAPGIRGGAGFVTQSVYEVVVMAKPFEVPSEIVADVSVLVDFDAVLRVSDLAFPGDTKPVTDESTPVAWIQPPRVAEEEEAVEAEEEFEVGEGEEAAEEIFERELQPKWRA